MWHYNQSVTSMKTFHITSVKNTNSQHLKESIWWEVKPQINQAKVVHTHIFP